jgi:glycosyltransferase involved in cell wall biosynthesis
MRRAAVVFHNSLDTRDRLLRHNLVDPARLVHAPLGVADEFRPGGTAAVPWLPPGRWLLHVGSCIPRKRADVLLDVVAAVRAAAPDVRLVKVGGEWTAAHRERIDRHRLADAIVHARGVSRAELAEAYRRAAAVLVPSEAEGFGLPVAEALACGAAVVASDIPPLREAGGPAAVYRPVGDVPAWADAVLRLLADRGPPVARAAWAARFSWRAHAETIAAAYHRLGWQP